MDNIGYSVPLTIDYSGFTRAIKEIERQWDSLTIKTKKKFSIDFDARTEEIEDLREELKTAEANYNRLIRQVQTLDDIMATGRGTNEQRQQLGLLRRELEKARGDVLSTRALLEGKISGLSEWVSSIKGVGDRFKVLKEDVKAVKKPLGDLPGLFKKMGLAIIGVRSGFMAFRKIVSTAMSNSAELTNKFNAVWQVLGNAITPVLNKVANALLTLFSYLNTFIVALTGGKVNLLASAMATANKNTKATAGSMKELNKQLAGFDELNNMDNQSSSGGGVSAGGLDIADAFKDIQPDVTWTERIQAFGEWVRKNWPLVAGLLLGTYTTLKLLANLEGFSKIAKDLGLITDNFTIWQAIGIGLIIAGIVTCVGSIVEFIKNPSFQNLPKLLEGIAVGVALISGGLALVTGNWTFLFGLIISGLALVGAWVIKHWDEVKTKFSEGLNTIKNWVSEKATQIGDWFVGVKDKVVNAFTTMASKAKEIMTNIRDNWKTILGNGIVSLAEGMVNGFIKGVNFIIRALNKISFNVPDWVPLIGGKSFGFNLTEHPLISLPRLDSGTNYVPNDQLAMIHKGEAVIPKKFNDKEYFGASDEVLAKLDQFMSIVEGIDFNTYLDGKKVSKEVTRYQRQQERVMGGAF